jgi:hypothetical protein
MKRQTPKGFGKFQPGTVRHVSSSVHPEVDELYEAGLRADQAWFANGGFLEWIGIHWNVSLLE